MIIFVKKNAQLKIQEWDMSLLQVNKFHYIIIHKHIHILKYILKNIL